MFVNDASEFVLPTAGTCSFSSLRLTVAAFRRRGGGLSRSRWALVRSLAWCGFSPRPASRASSPPRSKSRYAPTAVSAARRPAHHRDPRAARSSGATTAAPAAGRRSSTSRAGRATTPLSRCGSAPAARCASSASNARRAETVAQAMAEVAATSGVPAAAITAENALGATPTRTWPSAELHRRARRRRLAGHERDAHAARDGGGEEARAARTRAAVRHSGAVPLVHWYAGVPNSGGPTMFHAGRAAVDWPRLLPTPRLGLAGC